MPSKSGSRLWFLVHSWIGLKLSLFMSFILITGTLAVFGNEIDWLLNAEMRAPARVAEADVAWGAAYDSLREVYPEGGLISLDRYHNPAFALSATLVTEWRENAYLWFSPVDGTFQGARDFYGVQRFLRNLHRHLMLPVAIGVPIVAFLAFPLLISLVAGFVVYKKFWRGFLRWPRFDRKPRIWLGDIHRLSGLWLSWFVALIALTSVFYFVEELGLRGSPFPRPERALLERDSAVPADFTGADLDRAVALARQELPQLRIRRILFPGNSNGAIAIQGENTAILVRPRANAVYIDPASVAVVGSYTGEELNFYTRISEAADPLHFGDFGGFFTQLLWFLFGAVLSGLGITGVLIYLQRIRGAVRIDNRKETPGSTPSRELLEGGAI